MAVAPLQIAVAVVTQGDRVLVGRRAMNARHAAGLHEFPGGKVEPGESPAAAAVARSPFIWVAIPLLAELDFPPANAAVIRQLERTGSAGCHGPA